MPYPSPADPHALVEANVAFAYHLVNVHARSVRGWDRQDVVQAALLGLWEAARRFDPSGGHSFLTYAGKWVKFQIVNATRALRRRREVHSELAELHAAAPDGPDPDARSDAVELLATLPPREREILLALYVDGRTTVELARRFGVTGSRIGQIRKRAIERLRERVAWADVVGEVRGQLRFGR